MDIHQAAIDAYVDGDASAPERLDRFSGTMRDGLA